MIGGGFVGHCCAWLLQQQGHQVQLIAPATAPQGSAAALGLLMAEVYQRRSGRGWRLRRRSMQLLQQWQEQLQLPIQRGLLLLASEPQEWERQQRLVQQSQCLELLSPADLKQRVNQAAVPELPDGVLGGVWSSGDGQLDPMQWIQRLQLAGAEQGLERVEANVIGINGNGGGPWTLRLDNGSKLSCDWLVIAAGLGSSGLLESLGHSLPMDPVLGQALELQLGSEQPAWNGCLIWKGINLVPRPNRRLWLGATVEPGDEASPPALAELQSLEGTAPSWLQQAQVLRQWQGLRARPSGQPAPVLEQPKPRLLVVSGHYRNGILLAPACAEWAATQIQES